MLSAAEISSLRALLAAVQGLAATATELLDAAQGVPQEAPEEPQPKRPRYLGDDDPPEPKSGS